MKIQIILFSISLVAILSNCSNPNEQKRSKKSDLSDSVKDTLIFSAPQNYLLVLDNYSKSREVEIRSYKDILALFEQLNYTPAAWQAGIREVPRVYLPIIGDRWSTKSNELSVADKKRIFFRGLAPLILRANELIMTDRNRLLEIMLSVDQNKSVSEKEQHWILKLARWYKVDTGDGQITTEMTNELLTRVDIVPTSLALAQAAEESGWGTSRFAAEGNAVYGQWTWGEKAIVPEKQRKEMGNYGIASFETLQESVCAYMINLNTHNAYADLRIKRASMRKKGEKITGYELAGQLTKYSERGEEYVTGLRSLMDYNQLKPTDDAYLSDNPPIYLIPAAQ